MYEHFYGLAEQPFNLTPDSKFLYSSQRHQEALQSLLYGVRERKGFICLTGEIGSGKTTLLRAMLSKLDGEQIRTALILNSYLTDLELLKTINEEFGLSGESDSKKELLDELNAFLVDQFCQGTNCVLIIDEAQNLRPDTLEQIRMISNLETETTKLIQIMLVGQPELRDTLSLPELEQLNQRITVRYHVTPLDESEIFEYISHRMQVARAQVSVEFTPQAIRLIYHHSRGIPRRINVITDRVLLVGYVLGRYDIDGDVVERAIAEVQGDGQPPAAEASPSSITPTRRMRRPVLLVPAGLSLGLLVLIAAGIWAGGTLKNISRTGEIGIVQPVSASSQHRSAVDREDLPEIIEAAAGIAEEPIREVKIAAASLTIAHEPPSINLEVLPEPIRVSEPKVEISSPARTEPEVPEAADAPNPIVEAIVREEPEVASAPEPVEVAMVVETQSPEEPVSVEVEIVSEPDSKILSSGSQAWDLSGLGEYLESLRESPDSFEEGQMVLASLPADPAELDPLIVIPERTKPWSRDEDFVVRVEQRAHSESAAFITLLQHWGIEVDLEPFAAADPDEIAQYDMQAMVRQLDFEAYRTRSFYDAVVLDLPMVARMREDASGYAPYVAVLLLKDGRFALADPLSGVRSVSRRELEDKIQELIVLYRDTQGWTDLPAQGQGESVRTLQDALVRTGHLANSNEGSLGANTEEAIRQFQLQNGLAVTGRMSALTTAHLSGQVGSDRPVLLQ